jgi:hypothetical protein
MRKSGFSEDQTIRMLWEYEAEGSSPEPFAALTPPVLSGNLNSWPTLGAGSAAAIR